jgi:hypothetical protein
MGTLAYFAIFLDSLGGALGVAVDTEATFGTESDGAGGAVVLEAGLAASVDADLTALLDLTLTALTGAGLAFGLVWLAVGVLAVAGVDLVLEAALVLGLRAALAATLGFTTLGLALPAALADVLFPATALAEDGVDLGADLDGALAVTLVLGAADFVSALAFGGALVAGLFAATSFFTLGGVALAAGLTLLATTVFFTSNLLAVLNALISITWAKHGKTRGASEQHTL